MLKEKEKRKTNKQVNFNFIANFDQVCDDSLLSKYYNKIS